MHKQIKRGFHKNGIYHINKINSLHSRFKQWLAGFKGVSTKYLPNYLSFFKLVEMIKGEKEPVQNKNTLLYGTSGFVDARISNFTEFAPELLLNSSNYLDFLTSMI